MRSDQSKYVKDEKRLIEVTYYLPRYGSFKEVYDLDSDSDRETMDKNKELRWPITNIRPILPDDKETPPSQSL